MSASAKPVLGYVGVGLMGGPMVARLASRGWAIRAYDVVPERLAAAVAAGARPAVSPADAARGAGLVLLNLPTTDAVEHAVFGEDGVASGIAPPARVVQCDSLAALTLLRHSDAVGVFPQLLLGHPETIGIVAVEGAALHPCDLEVLLLTRADVPLTPAAEHFAHCLTQVALDTARSA